MVLATVSVEHVQIAAVYVRRNCVCPTYIPHKPDMIKCKFMCGLCHIIGTIYMADRHLCAVYLRISNVAHMSATATFPGHSLAYIRGTCVGTLVCVTHECYIFHTRSHQILLEIFDWVAMTYDQKFRGIICVTRQNTLNYLFRN